MLAAAPAYRAHLCDRDRVRGGCMLNMRTRAATFWDREA